jgi:aryl carrier-like protein
VFTETLVEMQQAGFLPAPDSAGPPVPGARRGKRPDGREGWFLPDPDRPGKYRYRSGDYGRLRADGKLEFLGRRDAQVKISGFRIEIGEIENQLLKLPGVRECAVVVAEHAGRNPTLTAFCSGDRPLDPALMRDGLARSLPAYMLPSAFQRLEALPLTANGKTDRKALTALAAELERGEERRAQPDSDSERRLAAAWAEVLGLPQDQIGRGDNFFDLGGTSLSVLKLAVALGRSVSFRDLTAHPILAEQATLIDPRALRASSGPVPSGNGAARSKT